MEIVKESKKLYLRGINEKLAKKFKESSLCTLVKEDKVLLACIRNNAIGIYHLADKVAMVHCNREGELVCDVNDFYVSGKHTGKEHQYKAGVLCTKIRDINIKGIAKIPVDTDVLITHNPPINILDFDDNIHYGSPELLTKVNEINPQFHLFGHIHASNGEITIGATKFVNSAIVSEDYSSLQDYHILQISQTENIDNLWANWEANRQKYNI